MFTVGKILAWDATSNKGILECALTGQTYQCADVHPKDTFREGMRVTFVSIDPNVAVQVQNASAAFSRLASVYNPDENAEKVAKHIYYSRGM